MSARELSETTEEHEQRPVETPERESSPYDGWGDASLAEDDRHLRMDADDSHTFPSEGTDRRFEPMTHDGWGDSPEVSSLPEDRQAAGREIGDSPAESTDGFARRAIDQVDDDGWGSERIDTPNRAQEAELSHDHEQRIALAREGVEAALYDPDGQAIAEARRNVEDAYAVARLPEPEVSRDGQPGWSVELQPLVEGDKSNLTDSNEIHKLADLPIADLVEVPTSDHGNETYNGHRNETYKVHLVEGQVGYLKPETGVLSDRKAIPKDSEWRREVAAYEFDKVADLGVVPETVVRHEPQLDFANASLQAEAPLPRRSYDEYTNLDRQKMAVLDYVLANSDRHIGNYLTNADGQPAAIDNGYSLPISEQDGIRSDWVTDALGKDLDDHLVAQLNNVDTSELTRCWEQLGIEDDAIDGALQRLAEVRSGKITGSAWNGKICKANWQTVRNHIG